MKRRLSCLNVLVLICFVTFVNGQEFRSIDGYGNNLANPEWGMAGGDIFRASPANYADGIQSLNDTNKPNPRVVSNVLFDQGDEQIFDKYSLSDYVWAFGQFLDHDITEVGNGEETLDIIIPQDDVVFIPGSAITINRSAARPGSGETTPRNFTNNITAFIDGSAIYGSDEDRAQYLRSYVDGKLRVSQGNLLPWNTISGEYNDPKDPFAPFMADDTRSGTKLFVAGDVRANENPLLLSLHTVFVREHNRICDELVEENPAWSDEIIYLFARKKVAAIFQSIVYNEWLPAMGVVLPDYQGYDEIINPSISNVFSAAAFRFGHTMINSNIIRMDNEGRELTLGALTLKDAFFNPQIVPFAGGIEPYLKGMATQVQQEMDNKVIDDVRNFLFGHPSAGGLDLAAINILRGRERGLLNYNELREWFGKPVYSSFDDLSKSPEVVEALEELYGDIDQLDVWVGLLSEEKLNGAVFGELIMLVLEDQFIKLREGDRYFYLNDPMLSDSEKEEISNTTLHDVIMRNCDLELMQKNLFEAMPHNAIPNGPQIARLQLEAEIYPNPVTENTILKVYAEIEGPVSVRIMDIHGKEITSFEDYLNIGENFISVDCNDQEFARGMYNMLIESNGYYSVKKMIKD